MKPMTKLLVTLVCMLALTLGLYAGEKKKETGVFPVCFNIATPQASGPTFDVNLLVNKEFITGFGTLTGVGPHPRRDLKLEGNNGLITCKNKKKRVLYLFGYQELIGPKPGSLKALMVRLYMIISEDWKSAEAAFSYMDDSGKWVDVNCTVVMYVKCFPRNG